MYSSYSPQISRIFFCCSIQYSSTIPLFWASDGQLQSYSLPDCNSEIICFAKTSFSADTHVLYHWQNDPYERIMYIAN